MCPGEGGNGTRFGDEFPRKTCPKRIDECHLKPMGVIFQTCQQGHRAKGVAKVVFAAFFSIWVSQAVLLKDSGFI